MEVEVPKLFWISPAWKSRKANTFSYCGVTLCFFLWLLSNGLCFWLPIWVLKKKGACKLVNVLGFYKILWMWEESGSDDGVIQMMGTLTASRWTRKEVAVRRRNSRFTNSRRTTMSRTWGDDSRKRKMVSVSSDYAFMSTDYFSHAAQGHLREGKCHLSLGNAKAASRCFRKVLELEPSNQEAKQEVKSCLFLLFPYFFHLRIFDR